MGTYFFYRGGSRMYGGGGLLEEESIHVETGYLVLKLKQPPPD